MVVVLPLPLGPVSRMAPVRSRSDRAARQRFRFEPQLLQVQHLPGPLEMRTTTFSP